MSKFLNETVLEVGKKILVTDEKIQKIFIEGFSKLETEGRWAEGDRCIISFKCENTTDKRLLMEVGPMPGVSQKFTVNINNNTEIFKEIDETEIIELPIIFDEDSENSNQVIIIFNFQDLKTPKELKINDDTRKLGLFFKGLKLI